MSRRPSLRLVAVALVGLAASAALWVVMHASEDARAQGEFAALCSRHARAIEQSFADLGDELYSLRGLYSASRQVERAEFHAFAQVIIGHTPMIRSISWTPRIPAAERVAAETAIRADAGEDQRTRDFVVRELAPNGAMIPVGARAEYFPVAFIEPFAANFAAYGFDMGSEPVRRVLLERARDLDQVCTTPPLRLVQETARQLAVVVYLPLFANGTVHATPTARCLALTGYVGATVTIATLVESALSRLPAAGLEMTLRDAGAPEAGDVIHHSRLGGGEAAAGARTCHLEIAVADRHWRIDFAAAPAFTALHRTWHAELVLAAALLASALACGLVRSIDRQQAVIARHVAERTRELTAAIAVAGEAESGLRRNQAAMARSEAALRASEERLQLALRGTNDGIFDWDLRSNTSFVSERMEAMLGYGPGEMNTAAAGDWTTNLIHPDHRDLVRARLQQHFAGESAFHESEFRMRTKDGGWRWILCRAQAVRGPDGVPRRMLATFTDIGVRKRAEQALGESQRQYQTLVDSLGVVVFQTDLEGRWTFLNPSWTRITGYAVEASLDQPFLDLVRPEERAGCAERFAAMLAGTAEVTQHQVRYRTASGEEIWVAITARLLRNAGGRIVGTSGTLSDVTAEREAQGQILRARDAAEAADRAKTEFLATVSHEIRTPMNGIIGMAELLARTRLEPDQRSQLEAISTCSGGLLALINDILDYSKIAAGRLDLENVPFDPRTLVEDAVALLAPQAAAKRLELTWTVAAEVPQMVLGDPGRLRQVLINLLANAVKFTPAGTVAIEVTAGAFSAHGLELALAIADTGIGISTAEQARLFQPFTQADSSTTRRFGGSGLGLAISKRLAELLGGGITLTSAPGRGSIFRCTIMVATAPLTPLAGATVVQDGVVVLAAAQVPAVRAMLASQLRNLGVTVIEAGDEGAVRAALASAADGLRPGLGILDLALAAALAGELRAAGLPWLLLGFPDDREHGVALGAAATLAKPLRREQLRRALRSMLAPVAVAHVDEARTVPPALPGRRILLVEDNPINQHVAQHLLLGFGCAVACAGSGREALDLAVADHFDAVLLDCQMPELDGYDTSRELRRRGLRIPIIALTANAGESDRARCLDAGMDDHLGKPVGSEALLAMLRRWLEPAGLVVAADATGTGPLSPPALDSVAFAVLRKQLGTNALAELYQLYDSQIPPLLQGLDEAQRRDDHAELRRVAHRLRGAVLNLCLSAFADHMRHLEHAATAGDAVRIATLMAEVPRVVKRANEALAGMRADG